MTVTAERIRAAADLLEGRIARTPCVPAGTLSRQLGVKLRLKLESMQPTGSFKVRGALVKLASLTPEARAKGVIAASAGNHAQGVAYHAQSLGIPATIVMPRGTPFTKVGRTRALGARTVLDGVDFSDAREIALGLAADEGLTFVPPYDDEDVICGQGTVALEMLADDPDLDCLVVPIGGGGLIAGMAVAARAVRPDVEIIGVEAELYPTMRRALRGELGMPAPRGRTVAEGIAVAQLGELTRPIVEAHVSDIVLVDEAALERGVYDLLDYQRLVAEGAAAATLAAVTTDPDRYAGRTVGLVISGGNIDPAVLSSILMRGLARQGRLVQLSVQVPDAPGGLAEASAIVARQGCNVVEVSHRRLFYDVPIKIAEVEFLVETEGPSHVRALVDALTEAGYQTRVLAGTIADTRNHAPGARLS